MRVAELYQSVQGEGRWTGVPSVFVRTSGCNLRCWYCDTPFTSWSPEGDDLSVAEILERVASLSCPDVVITGGEPMLWAELVPLCEELERAGRRVTIETAGTLDLPIRCALMSISPKRANSTPNSVEHPRWALRHEQSRHAPGVISRLIRDYDYQLKFVIDTPADCDDVERYLAEFPQVEPDRVWLMPQGVDPAGLAERAAWLSPYCVSRGYHFCPRRHLEWFGLTRGT